jgi:putative peptidoglycan lipid II flippase
VSLLRSNLVVAAGTALSRLTGLVRVGVLVYVLGRTAVTDVFTIANETPNIVYELLIGGALSATLVPLFTSFVVRDDDESTHVVLTMAMAAIVALTVIAVVAAPLVFGVYSVTPSGDVDADTLRSAGTALTRLLLVQILFYGMTALGKAYLESRRRFFAASWSPVLANLVTIAALLSLPDAGDRVWTLEEVVGDDRLRLTLGLGATAGIAAMALALVPAMWRAGYRPVFAWRPRHPAIRRLLVLSGWTLGYVVANQVAIAVIRNIAQPGSGDAAAYYVAYIFFVLPHGLLGVSIATTFQPEMARSVANRDRAGFVHQVSLGIRILAVVTIPAGFAMFVLRRTIVGIALERGAFDAADADATARALGGFALGLVGFSIYLFVLRAFYAHQDTRTPFVINVVENVLNIVLALVLYDRWGLLGLGLALAIAYLVSSVWAIQILGYKVRGVPTRALATSVARMLLAGVLMAEAVWVVGRVVGGDTGTEAAVRLLVALPVAVVVYVGVLAVLRAPEIDWLRRRALARGA